MTPSPKPINKCVETIATRTLLKGTATVPPRAYSKTKAITLAPVSYTHIIWATFFGYIIFDSLPNLQTLLGGVLIVSSGVYTYRKIN